MKTSFKRRIRVVAAAFFGLILLGSAALLDRRLTRRDREAYHAAQRDLLSVRDEILRYQYDTGTLPADLDQLCPDYLRQDLLEQEGVPLYRYNPDAQTIAMAEPVVLHGLIDRARPRVVLELPGSSDPAKVAAPSPEPGETNPPPVPTPEAMGPKLQTPMTSDNPAPPADAYVFEAETYSSMNWGWEIAFDTTAGGGAYIHSKEGISNYAAQVEYGLFDFHNIREPREYSILRYHVTIPETGRYYVYGRIWTTGSHCSNRVRVSIDQPSLNRRNRYNGYSLNNRTPFRWLWERVEGGAVRLDKGRHYFEIFMHEDGVRLDQFLLLPVGASLEQQDKAFISNLSVDDSTVWAAENPPLLDLTFSYPSAVITPEQPPVADLIIRRQRPLSGKARLRIYFADKLLFEGPLQLDRLAPVSRFAIPFDKVEMSQRARREYLLKAVVDQDGQVIDSCHVPLVYPMQWQVTKRLGYFPNHRAGPYDGLMKSADEYWEPLKLGSLDHFGVLDFGLQTINNSLHAPEWATIYARTRIRVPTADHYLLKIQADDNLLLWIDGKQVLNHHRSGPVTRSASRLRLHLDAGVHEVRMRVNQRGHSGYGDGRWQASLRFRTKDDLLSGITGCRQTQ